MRKDREYIEFKIEQAWPAATSGSQDVRQGMEDALQMLRLSPDQYDAHIKQSTDTHSRSRQWGFQFTLHLLGLDSVLESYLKRSKV